VSRARIDLGEIATDDLLRRGIAAARVGDADEARAMLLEVTVRDPSNPDAWLWLAGVERNPQTKRDALERVLGLRPDDPEAQDSLARLAEKYGQGVLRKDDAGTLSCAWHPDRATGLRCARCGRAICPECARAHPVGWRCKDCARALRSPLYKVGAGQYAAGLVVGLLASVGAAVLMGVVGLMWFVGFFLAAPAGTFVADVVSRAAGRKRGRGLQMAAAAAVVLGGLVVHLALGVGPLRGLVPYGAFGNLLYVVLGTGAAFYRLR
jgi:hypothetical protein